MVALVESVAVRNLIEGLHLNENHNSKTRAVVPFSSFMNGSKLEMNPSLIGFL